MHKDIYRVEPPLWWAGMNTPLQLLIHGKDIKDGTVEVEGSDLVVTGVHNGDSPNYLFVDVAISPTTQPGDHLFRIRKDGRTLEFHYRIDRRREGSSMRKGFDSSDVVYLIMPDRFARSGTELDLPEGIKERNIDRSDPTGRHGGDLQGITDHLDYLADLGVTTLWLTPFQLDNESSGSYHGYACGDYYNTDPRLGDNETYRRLVAQAHEKGLKVVMDVVLNHCGNSHWWMKDLPFADWVHIEQVSITSTYRLVAITDPNHSEQDLKRTIDGWFDKDMPDMGLENEYLLRYFIQTYVWWIEWSGVDSLRVDTFPYNDRYAASRWTKAILEEYPNINIVAECWHSSPAVVSYWDGRKTNPDGYSSNLPSIMDFPLQEAINKGFADPRDAWDAGMNLIYEAVAHDFLYSDPRSLLIFADNHDMARFADTVTGNPDKIKSAMTLLATLRGIPQLLYGTEWAFRSGDLSAGDGGARIDFPGGWSDDDHDLFSGSGPTPSQKDVYDHTRKLLNWRKGATAVHDGKTTHFLPEQNCYVYFRYNTASTVMVVVNASEKKYNIDWARYSERTAGFTSATDILTGNRFEIGKRTAIPPRSSVIFELS